MSDPFIGQITMFAGNFAPRNWAFCDGQLLQISQNSALFSILGTTYGGDGRVTFGLPDLRSRSPRHEGSGPGLDTVTLGQKSGNHLTTLTVANLPSHNHTVSTSVSSDVGNETSPVGNIPAVPNDGESNFVDPNSTSPPTVVSNSSATNLQGANQSFSNLPPYLGVNFIIALSGVFPSRN